jgi:hypothetical protein
LAYDKDKILADALHIIESEGIRKVTELMAYLPISISTFYEWELEKSEELLAKINQCKIARKASMRKKWVASDVPALQIAAYKLEADEDELELLTVSKVKQDTTMKFENFPKIVIERAGKEDTGN